MGLFDLFLGKRPQPIDSSKFGRFQMFSGYEARFHAFEGSIYQSELIRAVINIRAIHMSKLKVSFEGSARPGLISKLSKAPNTFQTWPQFLCRLSTILDIYNTAFVIPVFDDFGEPSGIFTAIPDQCEIVEYNDKQYLKYRFRNGRVAAIEYDYCEVLTKFQHKSEFFGEDNRAIRPTLDLISIGNQSIKEATKSSASYRFWARATNFSFTEDLKKERQRFSEANFAREAEGGGILLFPNTYQDIHQIEAKPWVIDKDQMTLIRQNVFEYFNVNEDILTNKAYGDAWSAFYEGAIEPFAIQFAEGLEKMLFTLREQSVNHVIVTSNRLQYMSNKDKLDVSNGLLDRGIMSINDIREIWNLPPVEGGDVRIIRGEYYNADEKVSDGMVIGDQEGANNEPANQSD